MATKLPAAQNRLFKNAKIYLNTSLSLFVLAILNTPVRLIILVDLVIIVTIIILVTLVV